MLGRACPLAYRYSLAQLAQVKPTVGVQTAYVVGGLYGNVNAQQAVFALADREAAATGVRPLLCWNGDFNFFNGNEDLFLGINSAIMADPHSIATAGNIEREVSADGGDGGCGCGYPPYVSDGVVDRSNAIMEGLRAVAHAEGRSADMASVVAWLQALPRFAKLEFSGSDLAVAVIHGDASSLAGWSFAAEMMLPPDGQLLGSLGIDPAVDGPEGPHEFTSHADISAAFEGAGVDVFACTHTCLPFGQDFTVAASNRGGSGGSSGSGGGDGRRTGVIMNNGSAGMPNFRGDPAGLITRISTTSSAAEAFGRGDGGAALYGTRVKGAYVEALPLEFDTEDWLQTFLGTHPAGGAAHTSYWDRMANGPSFFAVHQANRIGLARANTL